MRPQLAQERFASMPFPMYGVDLILGVGLQRFNTTPTGVNVRGFEPITGRGRGGSRPGLTAYAPIVPADPTKSLLIQHLNIIVDPQATALPATMGDGNGSGIPPANLGPTAVLDTSTPDELGPRTSGDYWVPLGGWGIMSRRQPNPTKPTITAYCVGIGLQIQGQGTAHSANTTTGTAQLSLNGSLIASLSGTATDTGQPTDQYYSSTTWGSTSSQVPSQNTPQTPPPNSAILSPLSTAVGGFSGAKPSNWHFALISINQSLFNISNPPGTAVNTLSISGTWSVDHGSDVFNQTNWTGVVAQARVLVSNDGGNTWQVKGGSSVLEGVGLGNPQQNSGAVIPPFPATSLSTTFKL